MNDEIICDGTDEIVCPWCGYEYADSWEYEKDCYPAGHTDDKCLECNKPMRISAEYNVTFTTTQLEQESQND